jgi:eukaryotic-like serine/threonine-protein kinase
MSLSAAQMERLSSLLDQALPLPPAARCAWLDALSPEDRPLLQSLRQALLEDSADAAGAQWNALPRIDGALAQDAAAADGRRAGQRVDAYELLRLLGSGGMADVWLARRADAAFERQVALKMPRLGRVPVEMAERFARECRILAGLEYPGIARLYDAGFDADGMPFIAMEYVQGEALTAWCDARCLDVAGRLGIFLQVLDAVGYAHARHVIHRDLKPSNILVTDQAQVRLLDFGVARLLDEQATDRPSVTRTYGRALTPEYASPELLRGDVVDVRSDIYSLGIVLHELLTGLRPGTSAAAATGTPARELGGEMRTTVHRALASNPDERYPDVASLAADLRRVLAGRVVLAPAAGSGRRMRIVAIGTAAAIAIAAMAIVLNRGQTVNSKITPHRPESVTAAHPSVAVLPFANLTGDASKEYLGDGMAEELINTLTRVPGLKVPARTSSFSYKGRKVDVRQIARDLGVGTIVEGSVRSAGNEIRVTAQLIDAASGAHLWSQTYNRRITDLFQLQDELATTIEQALQGELFGVVTPIVTRTPPTQDVEAYQLTLQGFSLAERPDVRNLSSAMNLFQKALARDPKYARAYAGVAMVHLVSSIMGKSWREGYAAAEQAARKALTLDPNSAEAELTLARLADERNDPVESEAHYRRALVLDPNDAQIASAHAIRLAILGQLQKALVQVRAAYAQAPTNPSVVFSMAFVHGLAGLDSEALNYCNLASELGVADPPLAWIRGWAAVRAGRYAEYDTFLEAALPPGVDAEADLERASELTQLVFAAITDPAKRAAALRARARLYPRGKRFESGIAASYCAESASAYAFLGAIDMAYDLQVQCLEQMPAGLDKVDAGFDVWGQRMRTFRQDKRFHALIARYGSIPFYEKYGPPDECALEAGKLICH